MPQLVKIIIDISSVQQVIDIASVPQATLQASLWLTVLPLLVGAQL
jgi:hypothetical protein